MKLQPDRRYTLIAIYALVVIVAAFIIFMLLGQVGSVLAFMGRVFRHLMPVVYGIVFAFLLSPILKLFESRLLPALFSKRKVRPGVIRAIAMLSTYLLTFALVAVGMRIVIPELVNSVNSIWIQMPALRSALNDWYLSVTAQIQQFSLSDQEADIFTYILANVADGSWYATGNLLERGFEFANDALASLLVAATTITASVFNIILGIVISIYILKDKKRLFAQLNKISVAIFPKRTYLLLHDIAQDINRMFTGFVIGRILDSIVIGILCAIGMSILRIPHVALVTVIIGVTNFIPIFGPIFGAIPAIFIIFTAEPIKALWFGIFILVIQQLESNFIGPKIMGEIIGLPPLMIIVSLILFVGLMGFVGMLIGVPLFAVIYSLARRFISFLLKKKGYPTATMEYSSERNPLLGSKED